MVAIRRRLCRSRRVRDGAGRNLARSQSRLRRVRVRAERRGGRRACDGLRPVPAHATTAMAADGGYDRRRGGNPLPLDVIAVTERQAEPTASHSRLRSWPARAASSRGAAMLAPLVLGRLNRSLGVAPTAATEIPQVALICPVCAKRQLLPTGVVAGSVRQLRAVVSNTRRGAAPSKVRLRFADAQVGSVPGMRNRDAPVPQREDSDREAVPDEREQRERRGAAASLGSKPSSFKSRPAPPVTARSAPLPLRRPSRETSWRYRGRTTCPRVLR